MDESNDQAALKRRVDEQVARGLQIPARVMLFASLTIFLFMLAATFISAPIQSLLNGSEGATLSGFIFMIFLTWGITLFLQMIALATTGRRSQQAMRQQVLTQELANQMYQQLERDEQPAKPKRDSDNAREPHYVELGDDGELIDVAAVAKARNA